jgi:hypothetical protein
MQTYRHALTQKHADKLIDEGEANLLEYNIPEDREGTDTEDNEGPPHKKPKLDP